MSCKFPVGVDRESPVSGVGQGGGHGHFRAAGERRIPVDVGIPGGRSTGPEVPAPSPRSCGLGLAGRAALGSLFQDFGLGAGSAALLQALATLAFRLNLPLLKQGIFLKKKTEPAGTLIGFGESHINMKTRTLDATKSDPERLG